MRTGRPIPPLALTEEQRGALGNWARRPKTAQAMAMRARIILASAETPPPSPTHPRLHALRLPLRLSWVGWVPGSGAAPLLA